MLPTLLLYMPSTGSPYCKHTYISHTFHSLIQSRYDPRTRRLLRHIASSAQLAKDAQLLLSFQTANQARDPTITPLDIQY